MSRKKKAHRHPAHPANLPIWLGVVLAALVAQLPWRWLLGLGRLVGMVTLVLARERRRIAETNIDLCFPQLSEGERRRLARESVIAASVGMMELVGVYFRLRLSLFEHTEIEGREHLEAAMGQGKGVLLLGMHFTTMEVAGAVFGKLSSYGAVYRPNDNALIDRIIRFGRGRNVALYIKRSDLRGLVRALRAGHVVWYAPDQDYGRKHSIFVPFFGVTAATVTATSRIAQLSGSPVVPIYSFRLPKGRYRLVLEPALTSFPSGNEEEDARRINEIVENAVRRAPEQYLWVHRRFKHQPEGVPRPY